jgi:hypothetical protein
MTASLAPIARSVIVGPVVFAEASGLEGSEEITASLAPMARSVMVGAAVVVVISVGFLSPINQLEIMQEITTLTALSSGSRATPCSFLDPGSSPTPPETPGNPPTPPVPPRTPARVTLGPSGVASTLLLEYARSENKRWVRSRRETTDGNIPG